MTAGKRATVSLLMIVRNEERQLADCLRPVAPLFDEVIIVDTGSVDQTRRVAASFTPQVFDFAWCDDFSAARNEALRYATGDWIFWLDADDRLRPENLARLQALLAGLGDTARAYLMNTACATPFACEGTNLVTHVRLFRRHPELQWRGRVHEQLRPEPSSLGYELVFSDVVIDHTGYQDAAEQQRKLNRDLRLLKMDYAVDPSDASTLLHLGLAHFRLGRGTEARPFLLKLLAGTSEPCEHLRQVYGVLATIAMREGNLHAALAFLDQGLSIVPDGEYLLYLRAECLYELDRFIEAKAPLMQILGKANEPQYRGGVPGDIKEKLAPRKLADILRLERDYAAAEGLLLSIVARYGDDTLSWQALGRVFIDSRQREKLVAVIERLGQCPQGVVFAALLWSLWHLSHEELVAAGEWIDRLIALAPQMPMARVLRADWLIKIGAPISDRIQACRDVLRVQPGHPDALRILTQFESAHPQSTSSQWSVLEPSTDTQSMA